MKIRNTIILLNIALFLYFFISIIISYHNLIPTKGTLINMEKSGNRIPYYTFRLKEFNCTFQNKGHSFLSLLTDNEYIYNTWMKEDETNFNPFNNNTTNSKITSSENKVSFYINKKETDRLTENQKIFYAGLHFTNQPEKTYTKIIDSYYYSIKNGKSAIYIIVFFCFCGVLVFFQNTQSQFSKFNLVKIVFLTDFFLFLSLMIL